MIFATTGTQVPFDRFVRMLDNVCADMDEEVIVQSIGGEYEPQHLRKVDFLPPDEFNEIFSRARLVVAHAGMGTILSALTQNKPLVVVPRLESLHEHRNDHQVGTAKRLGALGLVHVATDEAQLRAFLLNPLTAERTIGPTASASLIEELKAYIGE